MYFKLLPSHRRRLVRMSNEGLSLVIVELKGLSFFSERYARLLVLFRKMREKVLFSYSFFLAVYGNVYVVIPCISVIDNMTLVLITLGVHCIKKLHLDAFNICFN